MRKKIKLGYKGLTKDKTKEIPAKTDYFVFKNPVTNEIFFPELLEIYGSECKKLYITFPSNNPADFYNDNNVLYNSANNKLRECNGEICTHYKDFTINDEIYIADSQSECICEKYGLKNTENKELKKLSCKTVMHLKAMILEPNSLKPISPICYLFESGEVSASNIFSELFVITDSGETINKYSKYAGYPFVLIVKKIKKGETTYPAMILLPYIEPNMVIDYALSLQMQIPEMKQIEANETKQIEQSTGAKQEPAVNPENVIYEKLQETIFPINEDEKIKTMQDEAGTMIYCNEKTGEFNTMAELLVKGKNCNNVDNLRDVYNEILKYYPLNESEKKFLRTEFDKMKQAIIKPNF